MAVFHCICLVIASSTCRLPLLNCSLLSTPLFLCSAGAEESESSSGSSSDDSSSDSDSEDEKSDVEMATETEGPRFAAVPRYYFVARVWLLIATSLSCVVLRGRVFVVPKNVLCAEECSLSPSAEREEPQVADDDESVLALLLKRDGELAHCNGQRGLNFERDSLLFYFKLSER